jgi:hypothetical protein
LIFYITKENIIKAISNTLWYKLFKEEDINLKFNKITKQLHNSILNGIPIIIDPPVLYYLITLEFEDVIEMDKILSAKEPEKKKTSKLLKEMITDIIRLFYIQNYYSK